jgi:SH3 domain protein
MDSGRRQAANDEDLPVQKIALICLLSALAAHVQAQTVRYVTDSLRLEARRGPSTEHRIIYMLVSGDRVTVLEDEAESGYSRVVLEDGSEAWILTRFLMDEPAARAQLADSEEKLVREREISRDLAGQLETLSETAGGLEKTSVELERDKKDLQSELSRIKQAAADTLAIKERNEDLHKRVEELTLELEVAEKRTRSLKERAERDWFIAGAGVLLGGMILGLVLPKIRWRRRRSWGEL